jgi:hypothetical protein
MRWIKLDLMCIFFKNKLIYRCFNSLFPIYSRWIDCLSFFFWPNKIRVNPTGVVFSFFSPNATSPSTDAATLRRTSFPWNQNNLAVTTLSFSNVLSRHLPLELKPKHWNRTTAANHPPRTAWFQPFIAIKKIISTLISLSALNYVSILPPI